MHTHTHIHTHTHTHTQAHNMNTYNQKYALSQTHSSHTRRSGSKSLMEVVSQKQSSQPTLVHTHAPAHTDTHARSTPTYTHTHTHTLTHTLMLARTHINTHTHTHTQSKICNASYLASVSTYVFLKWHIDRVRAWIHTCVYVCVCVRARTSACTLERAPASGPQ